MAASRKNPETKNEPEKIKMQKKIKSLKTIVQGPRKGLHNPDSQSQSSGN